MKQMRKIISAIQNLKNKKLFFWKLVLGVLPLLVIVADIIYTSWFVIVIDYNNKMYYYNIDKEIESKKYDRIIDISDDNNDLYVVASKKNNGFDCQLMNSKGEILTDSYYDDIGFIMEYYDEEDSNDYYFDELYEEYYK